MKMEIEECKKWVWDRGILLTAIIGVLFVIGTMFTGPKVSSKQICMALRGEKDDSLYRYPFEEIEQYEEEHNVSLQVDYTSAERIRTYIDLPNNSEVVAVKCELDGWACEKDSNICNKVIFTPEIWVDDYRRWIEDKDPVWGVG